MSAPAFPNAALQQGRSTPRECSLPAANDLRCRGREAGASGVPTAMMSAQLRDCKRWNSRGRLMSSEPRNRIGVANRRPQPPVDEFCLCLDLCEGSLEVETGVIQCFSFTRRLAEHFPLNGVRRRSFGQGDVSLQHNHGYSHALYRVIFD